MNNNTSLTTALLSWLIGPSIITTSILALYNATSFTTQDNQTHLDTSEASQSTTPTPIMSEPSPTSTKVLQQMPREQQDILTDHGRMTLDRDLEFISGESEMPLSVYESPLLNAYRSFLKMKRENRSDGFYVVHRRRITAQQQQQQQQKQQKIYQDLPSDRLEDSIQKLLKRDTESDLYGEYNDSEVMLLYGRGPVFDESVNYSSDRFDGIED